MRLRDAADVIAQIRVQKVYQMFNLSTPNAVRPRIPNGNNFFLQALEGSDEGCTVCAGAPYVSGFAKPNTILNYPN